MALSDTGRIAVKATLLVFLTLVIVARFWIIRHRRYTPLFTASQIFHIFSWCFLVCITGMLILEDVRYREWKATPQPKNPLMHPVFSFQIRFFHFVQIYLYHLALWCCKGAFITLYYDIFYSRANRKIQILHHAVTFYVLCSLVIALLFMSLLCRPISQNWAPIPQCSNLTSELSLGLTSALNMVADIAVLSIPIFILKSLQLGRKDRYAYLFVLTLGVLSFVSSIARVALIAEAIHAGDATPDQIVSRLVVSELWSFVEILVAVLVYTLPAFRTVLRGWGDRRAESSGGSGGLKNFSLSSIRMPKWRDDAASDRGLTQQVHSTDDASVKTIHVPLQFKDSISDFRAPS